MVTSGWNRVGRSALALVAAVLVVGAVAPGAGAGTRERPTFWTRIEWPATSRCVSEYTTVGGLQSPIWGEPVDASIRYSHGPTDASGCRPVRQWSIDGPLKVSTFWVTRDAERGRLVASGWVRCTDAGCPSRYVKVHVDAWIRHDPTSTTAPGGAIAWGTVTINGRVVACGWSDNSETHLVYGPTD